MAENFKYYKVTNKWTQGVHYCCVDENNQVYLRNGATLNFSIYKSKIGRDSLTFEEVPRIVVLNNKKRYIIDQINTLRSRINQTDYEEPKDLVLISDFVLPIHQKKK